MLEFEDFVAVYPKRDGSQRWGDARRHWNARIKEGYGDQEMVDGAKRYAAYCLVRGIAGTEYVQQAATFLGRNCSFLEQWVTLSAGIDENAVRDTFNEVLPELARCESITNERRARIAALVSRYPKAKDVDWWRRYFGYVRAQCPLLMGSDGRWKATFDWLIDSNNFEKVREGQYKK